MLKSYLIVLSSKKGLYNLYYHKKALLPKYHMELSYGIISTTKLSQLQNFKDN